MTGIEKLQSQLKSGEAFLVSSPSNRFYLTDFESSDGYLIVTDKKSIFLTDSRYIEAAGDKIRTCDEVKLLKNGISRISDEIKALGIYNVYTERENMSLGEYELIRRLVRVPVHAEKTDSVLTDSRREKQQYEKERITAAQRIAEKAFDHILGFIRPGVTETDIRLELEFYMLRNGAEALSFDTIAITGSKTSMPHGVPGDKKVQSGDFVTMDYGAVVNGYHSDMTRTIAVESVSSEMEKVYNTVLKAQLSCLDILKAGVPCKEADSAARSIITEAGYGEFFGHGTGHGVGVEIHEAPSVSPRSKYILRVGDIVTDEPGIYLPGRFGVRIEDMAYITEDGCELLTECPKELIIVAK